MSKGIGGYMRRNERMQPQPDKTWWFTHCRHCGANLEVLPPFASGHICKELIYQCMPILSFMPIGEM